MSDVIKVLAVGADPELFLTQQGTVTHGIGRVGGSKSAPLKVLKGAVQEDNVLAEFNIDPATCADEFVENIHTVMGELERIIIPQGLETSILTSHEYEVHELQALGHKALEFGCEAEFSAWLGHPLPRPEGAGVGLRTAGGHIHIGYDDPAEFLNEDIGKMMDFVLGIPSVLMDSDVRRRSLYGKAGAIRHKPYGVEYRTLSNFWLKNEQLMRWAYEKAVFAAENTQLLGEYLSMIDADEVQRIINDSDVKAAKMAVNTLGLEAA